MELQLYWCTRCIAFKGISMYVVAGTIFNYALIALLWATESTLVHLPLVLETIKGNLIPRIVFAVSLLQIVFLAIRQPRTREMTAGHEESTRITALAMLCACSSTIILLSGRQGPLVDLFCIIAGWCIIQSMRSKQDSDSRSIETSSFFSFPVAQWSLAATCLFFCTGHWCALMAYDMLPHS